MKRILLTTTLIVITIHSMAQMSFTVKEPKFDKFVKITKEDVNLRKGPSAQSPKLMYEGITTWAGTYWLGAKDKMHCPAEDSPARFEGQYTPVVGETEDWVQFLFYGEGRSVYVKKEFCDFKSSKDLVPFTVDFLLENQIYLRDKGKYKGYCFEYYQNAEEDEYGIYVGKMIGKYIVMARLTDFYPVFDHEQNEPFKIKKKMVFEHRGIEKVLLFNSSLASNVEDWGNGIWQGVFDPSKLTDDQIDVIFANLPTDNLEYYRILFKLSDEEGYDSIYVKPF